MLLLPWILDIPRSILDIQFLFVPDLFTETVEHRGTAAAELLRHHWPAAATGTF
jgi:hypothetical protein